MSAGAAMRFRPTKAQDLDEVLSNLAARTRAEIDRFLHRAPPDERMSIIREHVQSSITARRADTFLIDDVPVGIITFTPENGYHYTTALAKERYFQRDCLRISKRYNADLARRLGTSIRAYSRSDHEKVASWFALLGFTCIGWDGDARVFVFPSDARPARGAVS